MELKYNDAVKQCSAEKNVKILILISRYKMDAYIMQKRKNLAELDEVLKEKIVACEQLEKALGDLQTENASLSKRVVQLEHDRLKHLETINEQANSNDKMRESLSKNKKKAELLDQAVQTAKSIMAQVLEVRYDGVVMTAAFQSDNDVVYCLYRLTEVTFWWSKLWSLSMKISIYESNEKFTRFVN